MYVITLIIFSFSSTQQRKESKKQIIVDINMDAINHYLQEAAMENREGVLNLAKGNIAEAVEILQNAAVSSPLPWSLWNL